MGREPHRSPDWACGVKAALFVVLTPLTESQVVLTPNQRAKSPLTGSTFCLQTSNPLTRLRMGPLSGRRIKDVSSICQKVTLSGIRLIHMKDKADHSSVTTTFSL